MKQDISTFFNKDYLQYAMYDSYRACACYIDGCKPTARKVIHTMSKFNINSKTKVTQLAAKCAEATGYLHGEGSMCGVIVNLAQNYVGSNNINLLDPNGSFGSRFIQEAAAPRYIFTQKSKYFDKLINKDDFDILPKQFFEGQEIEPKFFVPIIPLLLVNGSEGIGNGYAQKILPRDPKDLINFIKEVLKTGKYTTKLNPAFKGYKGKVKVTSDGKVKIYGKLEKLNLSTLRITEIPPNYDLDAYTKILAELRENHIIKNFKDYSDNDEFKFDIQIDRETGAKTEEELCEILKLVKNLTENFTCIDENNKIREFANVYELMIAYIKIRLEYYKKRREYLLTQLNDDLKLLMNRVLFIKGILDDKIVINKKSKANIEEQIIKQNIDKIEDSFDYLLNMPIYSLTKEKIEELINKAKNKKEQIKDLTSKTARDLWLEDLKVINE